MLYVLQLYNQYYIKKKCWYYIRVTHVLNNSTVNLYTYIYYLPF